MPKDRRHHHRQRSLSNSSNHNARLVQPPKPRIWLQLVVAIAAMVAIADNGFAAVTATTIKATATATATATTTAAAAATITGNGKAATFGDNNYNNNNDNVASGSHSGRGSGRRRNGPAGFSPLDKEVVDRLIKQWAPIVWLAPEEKFMPLGVGEFLHHVHPMDKGKTFIPGMPIGDNSEKAYLVTNAEIDELLEDEKSFLYGRNPNESPVPIYAVVALCNNPPPAPPAPTLLSATHESAPAAEKPHTLLHTLESTRGPYIPVSIDPLEEHNDTVRRSSRLYPVFKRVRRDEARFVTSPALVNLPSKALPKQFDLALGETSVGLGMSTTTATPTTLPESDLLNDHVSNFIANLADNVKFSGISDELDNNIDIDNSFNEPVGQIGAGATGNGNGQKHHQVPGFHVTYWMFYPYSQGKTMCTISLGPLGSIPFPAVYGFCLGRRKDIGSHIGDWEHMSLYFNGAAEPEAMYVSAHDAGAYYSYNRLTGSFEFKKQETRKGILQRPNFPKTVTTFNNHPVLFAAKGSHGLWTAPGKHRFVKVARLYDINGFGTPWNTWKAVEITYENLKSYGRELNPSWLSFKGKWGNPKSKCHPFRRIGLNFCEYTDGPTGIPLKEPHFQCGATTYR